jgi:hypothetical protein
VSSIRCTASYVLCVFIADSDGRDPAAVLLLQLNGCLDGEVVPLVDVVVQVGVIQRQAVPFDLDFCF